MFETTLRQLNDDGVEIRATEEQCVLWKKLQELLFYSKNGGFEASQLVNNYLNAGNTPALADLVTNLVGLIAACESEEPCILELLKTLLMMEDSTRLLGVHECSVLEDVMKSNSPQKFEIVRLHLKCNQNDLNMALSTAISLQSYKLVQLLIEEYNCIPDSRYIQRLLNSMRSYNWIQQFYRRVTKHKSYRTLKNCGVRLSVVSNKYF